MDIQQTRRYSSLLVLTLTALMAAMIFDRIVSARIDFYNELWAPAHLLVHGENPYDTSSLKPNLSPIWFPMAKGLFAPLGWLDANTAAQAWFLYSVAGLLAIVLLTLRDEASLWVVGATGLFVYFFPPVINHFVLGQFSITTALCLLLAARSAQRKWDWLAAFLLALSLTKPQLGFFAAIGLGIYYFKRDGWQGVPALYARTLCMALILSLPLFIAFPSWPSTWLANVRANPGWAQPSVFLMLSGAWKTAGVAISLLFGLYFCVYIWQKRFPESAMEWTLALTTIFAPYIWSWDFVLLLPLWVSTFRGASSRNKIILGLASLCGWAGMFYSQIKGSGNNQFFWWVPLWFVGIILIASKWD